MRVLATMLVSGLWLQGGLAHAAETMRAIGFIPKNDPVLAMANVWVNDVNAKLGKDIRINYVGGPEVIGRYQQIEAARNGVIDILFSPANDYQDQLPSS